jgi:hypothetical protein
MKKSLLLLLWLAATTLMSCQKDEPIELIDYSALNAKPGFLVNQFKFTYSFREPDSTGVQGYYTEVFSLTNDSSANVLVRGYNTKDSLIDEYTSSYNYFNRLMIVDAFPLWFTGGNVGEVKDLGGVTIKFVQKDINTTTPLGTFSCNRFDVTIFEETQVVLVDKDFKYPFIKLGFLVNNQPEYFYEAIKNK